MTVHQNVLMYVKVNKALLHQPCFNVSPQA